MGDGRRLGGIGLTDSRAPRTVGKSVGKTAPKLVRNDEQAHVPAQQSSAGPQARFPAADAHPCRPGHPVRASAQGPRQAVCLTLLAQVHRMRRGEDFQATVRSGRKARASSVVVHLDVPADAGPALGGGSTREKPLIGFVVTKSIGPAVVRNRVKRRLRHLMRSRVHQLPSGARLVVRALPSSASRPYGVIAADLDLALSQASA